MGKLLVAYLMLVALLVLCHPVCVLADGASGAHMPAVEDSTGVTPVSGTTVAPSSRCECEACRVDSDVLRFFGPAAIINQQPPNPVFLSPIPGRAVVTPPGERWARFKLDLTNHMIIDNEQGYTVHYDFESVRIEPELHFGLEKGELSLRYTMWYVGPGFLDGIIRGFHQLINQRSDVRMSEDSYLFVGRVEGPDGLVYEVERDKFYLGDLITEYKYPIWDRGNGEDALSCRAAVKVPLKAVDSDVLDTGNFDYSLGVLYQRQLGRRWRGYLNFDYVFISPSGLAQVNHNNSFPVAVYAVEYAINPRTTGVLQWRRHPNPISYGSAEMDQDSEELSFAVHHDLGDNTVFTFGMSEDAKGMTAPDVTFMGYLQWDL